MTRTERSDNRDRRRRSTTTLSRGLYPCGGPHKRDTGAAHERKLCHVRKNQRQRQSGTDVNKMRRPTEYPCRHCGQRVERTCVTAALLLCGVIGCTGTVPIPGTDDVIDGNRDTSVTSTLGKTSGEPNGAFFQPVVAVFDAGGVARLQGTVDSSGSSRDLDVFLIGRLNIGDRVIVDADTTGSLLDISIALFDTEQRLVAENDDRSDFPDLDLDSYIDWIARHAGNSYYLVVTGSTFAGTGRFAGTYTIDVQVTPGSIVPEPAEQILPLRLDIQRKKHGDAVHDRVPVRATLAGQLEGRGVVLERSATRRTTEDLKELVRNVLAAQDASPSG